MAKSVILRCPDDLYTWYEDQAREGVDVETVLLTGLIEWRAFMLGNRPVYPIFQGQGAALDTKETLRLIAQRREAFPLVIVNPKPPASVPLPSAAPAPQTRPQKKARRRYRRGGARA